MKIISLVFVYSIVACNGLFASALPTPPQTPIPGAEPAAEAAHNTAGLDLELYSKMVLNGLQFEAECNQTIVALEQLVKIKTGWLNVLCIKDSLFPNPLTVLKAGRLHNGEMLNLEDLSYKAKEMFAVWKKRNLQHLSLGDQINVGYVYDRVMTESEPAVLSAAKQLEEDVRLWQTYAGNIRSLQFYQKMLMQGAILTQEEIEEICRYDSEMVKIRKHCEQLLGEFPQIVLPQSNQIQPAQSALLPRTPAASPPPLLFTDVPNF